jgi:hypothetical protein
LDRSWRSIKSSGGKYMGTRNKIGFVGMDSSKRTLDKLKEEGRKWMNRIHAGVMRYDLD